MGRLRTTLRRSELQSPKQAYCTCSGFAHWAALLTWALFFRLGSRSFGFGDGAAAHLGKALLGEEGFPIHAIYPKMRKLAGDGL